MRVLVIGGTGFIGYHIVRELLARGDEVSLLTRNPARARDVFGEDVHYRAGDLAHCHDAGFAELFEGIDALIYAAGADERQTPVGEPYAFFYQENVTTCTHILELARQAGVRHALVLGSIFSHFSETRADLQLHHHPYIRSRVEQKSQALALADPTFTVNIIEIPFVFGHTPGHPTLWKNLVHYIRVAAPMVAPEGGANVISVQTLARAVVNALQYIDSSRAIAVGDCNMTWVEMMTALSKIVNKKPKKITMLQSSILADLTRMGAFFQELAGFQSGLDHHKISGLITFEAFFDTSQVKKELHYQGGDLEQAFIDTVKACPDNPLVNNLQKYIDWISDQAHNTARTLNKINRKK